MTKDTTPLIRGEAPNSAAVVCVVTHGRGQSPEAMDEHIVKRLQTEQVSFVLPRAASGTWYDARAMDPLNDTTRGQLASALQQLRQAADMAPRNTPVVMVGFSQGACLTLEYGFAFGPWRGALVSFTGCSVGTPADRRVRQPLAGLPVYLSGAEKDPWIPVSAFASAVQQLGTAGARLRADVFPRSEHEVSSTEIAILQSALDQLAGNQEVAW